MPYAKLFRIPEQLCLLRVIDQVDDGGALFDDVRRYRTGIGVRVHADGRRVDQHIDGVEAIQRGVGHRVKNAVGGLGAAAGRDDLGCAEVSHQIVRAPRRAARAEYYDAPLGNGDIVCIEQRFETERRRYCVRSAARL